MRRGWLWWICASALLAGGLALYLLFVYALQRPEDPEAARELRTALSVYGRVVLVKGVLPQLWIALALAGLLERRAPRLASSRARRAGLFAACAGIAGLLIASTLLRAQIPGSPRVVFSGPLNFARTWLEMTTAVAAAMWLPRAFQRKEP
ncbi:MAG TPA: hypothetical protein VFY49_20415 [Myxococcota bacterium]|nr:hypothetical protein [Myxococcota bacterium]